MKGDLLKAADLRPLDDAGLLYLAVRISQRVAPWCPPGAEELWATAIELVVAAANGDPAPVARVQRLAKQLLEQGAKGAYSGAPEAMWRSRSQAASTLSTGLSAVTKGVRKERWKQVVGAGKHSASVFAVQAHAGALPLSEALTVPWAAMRGDITALTGSPRPTTAADLLALAPLWPGGEPSWARP